MCTENTFINRKTVGPRALPNQRGRRIFLVPGGLASVKTVLPVKFLGIIPNLFSINAELAHPAAPIVLNQVHIASSS